MARRPTASKSAPSGPAAGTSSGGGSAKDRNRIGAAAGDSSKRAASVTGTEAGDDKGSDTSGSGEQRTERQASVAKKEKSKPETYIVLTDRAVIDDGEGGDFKVCKMHDEVKLTPERARQFTDAGVSLLTKDEHKQQQQPSE